MNYGEDLGEKPASPSEAREALWTGFGLELVIEGHRRRRRRKAMGVKDFGLSDGRVPSRQHRSDSFTHTVPYLPRLHRSVE